jgi:hypothetical protein
VINCPAAAASGVTNPKASYVFVEGLAPADYVDTLNTQALPRYVWQEEVDFSTGGDA